MSYNQDSDKLRKLVAYMNAKKDTTRNADHVRPLEEARDNALEEAAIAGGNAAVAMLLQLNPDASALRVQMARLAVARPILALKSSHHSPDDKKT